MNRLMRYHGATQRFDVFLEQWGGAFLLLALRIYLGLVFFKAGLTKISDWGTTIALF